FNQSHRKKKNSDKDTNQFFKSLWIYAIIGAVSSVFMFMGDSYMFQMTLVFAILMFLLVTLMISDFSSVLLDIRDQNILYTKPVNPRTISMAKTLHICIYLFFLTGAVAGIPLIVGLVKHGVAFFLIFVVEI